MSSSRMFAVVSSPNTQNDEAPPSQPAAPPPTCPLTAEVFKKQFAALQRRQERLGQERARDEKKLRQITSTMTDKKKMARPDLSVLSDAELAARGASLAELEVALGHLYEAVLRHEAENKAIVQETRELGRMMNRVVDATVDEATLNKIFMELNVS